MNYEKFTREWYMEASNGRHHEYYLAVAARSGITAALFSPAMKKQILMSTDPHMNDVPLRQWDDIAHGVRAVEITMLGRKHYSLSSGVCALKAVAKQWKDS